MNVAKRTPQTFGRMLVEIFQTSDGVWFLQTYSEVTGKVFLLKEYSRLIDALDTATLLGLQVDSELPLNQFYKVA